MAISLYKTDAVILRTRNLGEADRIYILFSPLYGKIDAVAKGVRKPSSKFSGSLEVFSHVYLMLSEGKNMDGISQVDVSNPHYGLREDLKKLTCASYFIELVEYSILPGQENIELFSLVLFVLSLLEYEDNLDTVLRYMELQLLAVLGLSPVLDRCLNCGDFSGGRTVNFYTSLGGSLCQKCSARELSGYIAVSMETINFLRILETISPGRIRTLSPSSRIYRESRWILRHLLFYNIGKKIKSIEMLDSLVKAGENE
jgi:DNA repair protein RecO (recombination protein O)